VNYETSVRECGVLNYLVYLIQTGKKKGRTKRPFLILPVLPHPFPFYKPILTSTLQDHPSLAVNTDCNMAYGQRAYRRLTAVAFYEVVTREISRSRYQLAFRRS